MNVRTMTSCLLVVMLAAVCQVRGTTHMAPKFTLDLSKPPQDRWVGAVGTILSRHPWEESFGPTFQAHNASLFSKMTSDEFSALGAAVNKYFPEQAKELFGLSSEFQKFGHSVSYEYLSAWVYFHELAHTPLVSTEERVRMKSCAAILARSPVDASVWHARNMDMSPWSIRNITLHITVVQGGEVLLEAVDWYWITTGFMTAMKQGVAAVQENWRFKTVTVNDVFRDVARGVLPQVFLFRKTLFDRNTKSFADVLSACSSTPLIAPMYVALSAKDMGKVLIRSQNGTDEVVTLGEQSGSPKNGLLWTNYDSCDSEPTSDVRCKPAQALMIEMSGRLSGSSLGVGMVASAFPVHNPTTAYTAVMNAATGDFHAFVRDPLKPLPIP